MQKEHQFCLLCGRKLKKQETRIRGYGDICFEKMKKKQTNRLFEINTKGGKKE